MKIKKSIYFNPGPVQKQSNLANAIPPAGKNLLTLIDPNALNLNVVNE